MDECRPKSDGPVLYLLVELVEGLVDQALVLEILHVRALDRKAAHRRKILRRASESINIQTSMKFVPHVVEQTWQDLPYCTGL